MEHTFGIGHVFSQEFPGEHLVGSIGFLGLLSLSRRARRIGNGSSFTSNSLLPFSLFEMI